MTAGFAFPIIRHTFVPLNRGMEQLVARRAHNPKVTGSSPVPATFELWTMLKLFGVLLFTAI